LKGIRPASLIGFPTFTGPTRGDVMQHADRATAAVALLLYSGIILFGVAIAAGVCDYIAKRRDRG
jgi:hypothetical protein